jgi:hypothetical protein
MKTKLFLLLAIITLLGIAVVFNYGYVWAQRVDQKPPPDFDATKEPIRTEFSDYPDKEAAKPPDGTLWGLDPLQVLYTQPIDRPAAPGDPFPQDDDGLDFGASGEVDALANMSDALFSDLVFNADNLVVSFGGDPNFTGPPAINDVAAFMEDVGGNRNPYWRQQDLVNPDQLDDVDGLQIWPPDTGYANMYSRLKDFATGTSVYYWDGANSAQYVPWTDIRDAVKSASLDYEGGQHYTGPDSLVDLDALMVKDRGGNFDGYWNDGDTIIFSIRNTKPAGNWDGGEIVVLPHAGQPNSVRWLRHGGHLWNTAFVCSTEFKMAAGTRTEEVDAIEAYPTPLTQETPTLTGWGLIILVALLIASTIFILLKRRKAVVTLR